MKKTKGMVFFFTLFFSISALISLPCILSAHYENQTRGSNFRDYHRGLTLQESKEIRYILKTLATKSLTGLLKCRGDLERAGEAVESVHPLQFLLTVFTDEELKVYIHNIKRRGKWVWGEFIKGLKRSLQEEYGRGNLSQEMTEDFATQLQIPLSLINGLITSGLWEDFVKTLIVEIPREGDPGRYDQ